MAKKKLDKSENNEGSSMATVSKQKSDCGYTKRELQNFIDELSKQIVQPKPAYLHLIIALNHILRQEDVAVVLDLQMKEQLKDIWLKLKSTGVQLNDPPLLFN